MNKLHMEWLGETDEGVQGFRPSGCLIGDSLWAVWMRYADGVEEIHAGRVDLDDIRGSEGSSPREHRPKSDDPSCISRGSMNDRPRMVAVADEPLVVWLAGEAPKSLCFSVHGPGGWSAPELVRSASMIAEPALCASTDGRQAWCVWVEEGGDGFALVWAAFDGDGWSEPVRLATKGSPRRPAAAAAGRACWVAWDEYADGRFSVWATRIEGATAEPGECVSPALADGGTPEAAGWDLIPTVQTDGDGAPWVAWLHLTDVMNEDGVIDQAPTARCVRRDGLSWTQVTDQNGSGDLANLAWGLLSYQGAGVLGYLGRRRKPTLAADSDGEIWLLWERKGGHNAPTAKAEGLLCGRPLKGGIAAETVLLAAGPRYYEPVAVRRLGSGGGGRTGAGVIFVGRAAPTDGTAELIAAVAESDETAELESPRKWSDWTPVAVRPAPEANGSPSGTQLYWADLHVHTGLSADAEGEIDELVYYARDKAGLDCVILQDNDHYNLSLTPSEYEEYLSFVDRWNEDGRFVLLPGFEWTYYSETREASRTPDHRTVFGVSPRFPLLRNVEAGPDPLSSLCRFLEKHDGVAHIHHERFAVLEGCRDINFEVCSGWQAHMALDEHRKTYHAALAAGHRLGFVGGSDNHRRNPGMGGALTGLFADGLTRGSIVEALRAHRCFATTGSRIVPRLWVNDCFIGETVSASGPAFISWDVAVPKPPAAVELVRDGRVIESWQVDGPVGKGSFEDKGLDPGAHFYYLQVRQSGEWAELPTNLSRALGPFAWTSPIWVERR